MIERFGNLVSYTLQELQHKWNGVLKANPNAKLISIQYRQYCFDLFFSEQATDDGKEIIHEV